jgi:hypothetical protein
MVRLSNLEEQKQGFPPETTCCCSFNNTKLYQTLFDGPIFSIFFSLFIVLAAFIGGIIVVVVLV